MPRGYKILLLIKITCEILIIIEILQFVLIRHILFVELIKCNITAGLEEVIIYSSPDDKKKNRGFCFLEYESHKVSFSHMR